MPERRGRHINVFCKACFAENVLLQMKACGRGPWAIIYQFHFKSCHIFFFLFQISSADRQGAAWSDFLKCLSKQELLLSSFQVLSRQAQKTCTSTKSIIYSVCIYMYIYTHNIHTQYVLVMSGP